MKARYFAMAALAASVLASAAWAKDKQDYIVTATKPDKLFLIDPRSRTIQREYQIPDANSWVGTIVPSPDGRIAYVLVNKMESISGIDLDTGKQIFRADLSSGNERVKSMFAFDVTPDGRELIAFEIPVKLGLDDYQVEATRFEVFRTKDGVGAKAVRRFAAPRRIHTLLMRKDGRSFFAAGFDLYEFDVKTGKQISVQGIRDWQRPGYSIPDVLAFWPVNEPTGIFASPTYSTVTPAGGGEPVAKTSLMTLDLHTGKLEYHDFEETSALIFSAVLSPIKPEAFGVYTQLTKIDTANNVVAKRIDLEHTFYTVMISSDGKEVYTGGTMCDVGVFDADTLAQKANIKLTGCGDQSVTATRVIRR